MQLSQNAEAIRGGDEPSRGKGKGEALNVVSEYTVEEGLESFIDIFKRSQ